MIKIAIVGGHLTPALSVIEALPKDAQIIYIGRKHALEGDRALSLEYETIKKKEIPFLTLKTGRVQRKFTKRTLPSVTKIPLGFAHAFALLIKHKPDVVVGFGGYVSLPVVFSAHLLKIPTVIHEQTLEAGAANKFAAKFATKICVSFETSFKYFPKEKTVLTGNPIRNSIIHPSKKFDIKSDGPIIFVTGGSLGSHAINLLIASTLTKILEKYTLVHQTGAAEEFKDYDKLSILKEGLNNSKRSKYFLSKFFSPDEIGSILKQSDLTISRAGINTVSEFIRLEKPSLLIPLPNTQRNEQLKNALFLKKLGLGEVIEQKNISPESFLKTIDQMIRNLRSYKLESAKSHFPKNAAEKIVEVIYASQKSNH